MACMAASYILTAMEAKNERLDFCFGLACAAIAAVGFGPRFQNRRSLYSFSGPLDFGGLFTARILEEAMYIENDDKICMNCQHRDSSPTR